MPFASRYSTAVALLVVTGCQLDALGPGPHDPPQPSPCPEPSRQPAPSPATSPAAGAVPTQFWCELLPSTPCVGDRITLRGHIDPGQTVHFTFGPARVDIDGRYVGPDGPDTIDFGQITPDARGNISFSFVLGDLSPTVSGGHLVIKPDTEYCDSLKLSGPGGGGMLGRAFRTCKGATP